jgi:hypothetical protein
MLDELLRVVVLLGVVVLTDLSGRILKSRGPFEDCTREPSEVQEPWTAPGTF